MSNETLILQERSEDTTLIRFSLDAETLKAAALEASALVCKVEDAKTQQIAVDAQQKLATLMRQVEKARQAAKNPLLEQGRTIDAAAKAFVEKLDEEGLRIAGLVSTFNEKERRRLVAEQQLQTDQLNRLERERAEKVACATTTEEQDQINSEYSDRAQLAQQPVSAPPRAVGQVVRPDWDVTVVDAHKLYRFHPNCVELKPRLSEIKALLGMGATVQGVSAVPIVKANVRSAKPPQSIEA